MLNFLLNLTNEAKRLRPPGAVPEAEFMARCVRCGRCAEACIYGSLTMDSSLGPHRNTPVLQPAKVPCVLCMKCPETCPSGALDKNLKDMHKVRMGKAYIVRQLCYNHNGGVMCSTCHDRCPLRGHAVVLKDGYIPAITDACAGCGVCAYVCPAKAVVIKDNHEKAPAGALPLEPAPALPDDWQEKRP